MNFTREIDNPVCQVQLHSLLRCTTLTDALAALQKMFDIIDPIKYSSRLTMPKVYCD